MPPTQMPGGGGGGRGSKSSSLTRSQSSWSSVEVCGAWHRAAGWSTRGSARGCGLGGTGSQAAAHGVAAWGCSGVTVLVADLQLASFFSGEAQGGEAAAQRLSAAGDFQVLVGERLVGRLDDFLLPVDVVHEEGAARDVGGAELLPLIFSFEALGPELRIAVPHHDLILGRRHEDHPGVRVPAGGGDAVAHRGHGALPLVRTSVGDLDGELLD